MEKQATINIGTIGHVAHGKSTIVQCISGISTIKYKAELERNITIKLGYANAKIYACECSRPLCYATAPGECDACGAARVLVRHVSFVDCPGHDVLMTTMLNGTAIMDAALLLVAANEPCPQPQTTEHLFAVEIMNLDKIVILQNKVDLVTREQALEQHGQIKEFLKTSNVDGPIVPVSGQFSVNINAILDFIVNYIEEPVRDTSKDAKMIVIRSFDINKPGAAIEDLQGGVIGGSLVTGMIRLADRIEVRPGLVEKKEGRFVCTPFIAEVTSLKAEKTPLEEAVPGGLIGVGTTMDPSFCKSDKLVGMVMGLEGTLPPIYHAIDVSYVLFQKAVSHAIDELAAGEHMRLNIGSTTTGCRIASLDGEKSANFELLKPCCCDIGDRVSISRKIKNNWRLIGHGVITAGAQTEISHQ
ncbi:translation initiation factor 2 subunit 3 [Pancytospora philotis]|nr:translation initiation factor 2 subunit 3 [Pancytospora philotis]